MFLIGLGTFCEIERIIRLHQIDLDEKWLLLQSNVNEYTAHLSVITESRLDQRAKNLIRWRLLDTTPAIFKVIVTFSKLKEMKNEHMVNQVYSPARRTPDIHQRRYIGRRSGKMEGPLS